MSYFKPYYFIIITCIFIWIFSSCKNEQSPIQKINGLSFVASPDTLSSKHMAPVKAVNANWTSVMPYGIMRSKSDPELYFNSKRHWYGERYEGSKQSIEVMQNNGLKVMLKPQIWISNGTFTGDIDMKSEENWSIFEEKYREMILLYAKLAHETQVDIYCIGTELNSFITKRPKFWQQLILEIKAIYKGKLTYAENWDKIEDVPFWSAIDYIGVDAYFPISQDKTPKLKAIKEKWQEINQDLEHLSTVENKPILFTEYGYRSIDYAGKNPWDASDIEGQVNEAAQSTLLQGLYESTWDKPWYAGGFLWKWFHAPEKLSPRHQNRFCVHGKKAEITVANWYGKY